MSKKAEEWVDNTYSHTDKDTTSRHNDVLFTDLDMQNTFDAGVASVMKKLKNAIYEKCMLEMLNGGWIPAYDGFKEELNDRIENYTDLLNRRFG